MKLDNFITQNIDIGVLILIGILTTSRTMHSSAFFDCFAMSPAAHLVKWILAFGWIVLLGEII